MKRVLLFHGGKHTGKKEDFSHTAQMTLALSEDKNIKSKLYDRKKMFSKDFFSKDSDLIISIGFLSFYLVFLRKIRMIKSPILHSWNDDYHKGGGFGGKWLRKKIEYWTVKNADFNLTCSKYRVSVARELEREIKFIPHGVIDSWDKIKPKKLEGFNLVYIGEFSKRKGVDWIKDMAKKFPDLNFHLFGRVKKGEEEILDHLPKNIILHGWVENEKVISYCKGADILLHPTDNDSTLKIHNYIKCGKVILAKEGQINYLLDHRKNAYITNNFENGLRNLLDNKKLRDKIEKNVKNYKIYYWKEIRKEYVKYVKKILR